MNIPTGTVQEVRRNRLQILHEFRVKQWVEAELDRAPIPTPEQLQRIARILSH